MSILPGWDSAETTATIAHNLHITAIIVLGLLFVSEGLALMYDSRKEHLVSVAATKAEAKRKADADVAETFRKAETEALQRRLGDADKRLDEARQAAAAAAKKAAELEAHQADRRLTEEQKSAILVAIAPYPGNRVSLMVPIGNAEAHQYARDFEAVFRTARWEIIANSVVQAAYEQPAAHGIEAVVHSESDTVGLIDITMSPGVGALVVALKKLGLAQLFSERGIETNIIQLRIGPK
jgi:hypothetical protein